MDPVDAYIGHDSPLIAGPMFAAILVAVIALRVIPLLIAASAIVKLSRFPDLRPLHILLLITSGLIATLTVIDDTSLRQIVPATLRTSGTWSFLWIFAIAWLGVTWVRSAIKTRLRPRVLDLATLAVITICTLVFALAILLATVW